MIKNVYAIYDVKAYWLDPFIDSNDDVASRGFAYSMANNPGVIGFAPGDFSLYRIGTYDTGSGTLVSTTPVFIMSGYDAVRGSKHED